ncbi:RDD family protein [bacterium]|nr:RDD family protein [bacterium]
MGKPATFFKRVGAGLIDLILGVLFFQGMLFILATATPPSNPLHAVLMIVLSFSACMLVALLFFIFLGATPGKLLLGLKVRAENGEEQASVKSLIRRTLLYPSALLPLASGFWSMLFDKGKRSSLDVVSGTRIVQKTKPGTDLPNVDQNKDSSNQRPTGKVLHFIVIGVGDLLILFIIVPFFYLIGTDVPLTTQAKNWFGDKYENTVSIEKNGFYLFSAFGIPDSLDPIVEAEKFVAAAHAKLPIYNDTIQGDVDKNYTLPVAALYEGFGSVKYLYLKNMTDVDSLLVHATIWKKTFNENEFLLERMKLLASREDFITPIIPHQGVDIPHGIKLIQYFRLISANTLINYVEDNREEALELILLQHRLAYNLVHNTDNMLLQLTSYVLYSINLNTFNLLLDLEYPPTTELVNVIASLPELGVEGRSLRKALQYESWIGINTYQRLLEDRESLGNAYESVLAPLLIKMNHTKNLVSDQYGAIADYSEQSPLRFAENYPYESIEVKFQDQVRNIMGAILVDDKIVYVDYAERLFYEDAWLVMLKAKNRILTEQETPENVAEFLENNKSIFYNVFTNEKLLWDEQEKAIKLIGPNDKEHEDRITLHVWADE